MREEQVIGLIHVTEATYEGGALQPLHPLKLPDGARVRIIVQRLDGGLSSDRAAALRRLRAGIAIMGFRSEEPYPTRDSLHERH